MAPQCCDTLKVWHCCMNSMLDTVCCYESASGSYSLRYQTFVKYAKLYMLTDVSTYYFFMTNTLINPQSFPLMRIVLQFQVHCFLFANNSLDLYQMSLVYNLLPAVSCRQALTKGRLQRISESLTLDFGNKIRSENVNNKDFFITNVKNQN